MNSHSTPRNASPGEAPPSRRARRARSGGGVLSIKPFRALWIALSLSSLGDWLSILALLWLAPSVTNGSNLAKTAATGGVWVVTLLPALLLGPIAGALADRFDRRVTMIVGDVIRGLLFVSIPLFPNLTWIFIAKFLAGVASQFWNPAASATIPNLVPKEKLERANQVSQLMTYGTAPLAALLLIVLGWISTGLGHFAPVFHTNKLDLALYFNGATYLVSAITVYFLRQIGKREHSGRISAPSTAKAIWEGWRFIKDTPVVRGLVIGMLGAFCAAGVVIGLASSYIQDTLEGGPAGFSLVFATILVGLALGMGFGSRPFGKFSRRRLFGVALTASAVPLALIALVPDLVAVTIFVFLVGVISGTAYPTGFTIVGLEVDDDTRGRVFAFFQSTIQAILLMVIAVSPFIATGFSAAIGALAGTRGGAITIVHVTYGAPGDNLLLLLSAALVAFVGIQSYRQLDDRKGIPLFQDLWAAVRNEPLKRVSVPQTPGVAPGHTGLFLAFEGGEGSGKTTQARLAAIWLREQGFDVVTTHEPGATKIGMRLRALLLDTAHAGMSPHCEALLYAADRAEHVAKVIDPALDRGAIVITDRYIDSSLAYQGTGRGLHSGDIAWLNSWATDGREPDLTVLLDMDPEQGLNRRARSADRLEAEPLDFHRRVRVGFLTLAKAKPDHYLIVDATAPVGEISEQIKDRVRELLPDPVPRVSEAATGSFAAVPDHLPDQFTDRR
ncbi:MAG TPA: dTMP kinase [Trebonia sp.]|nr:dTMP kinase [Trebonia sp.]